MAKVAASYAEDGKYVLDGLSTARRNKLAEDLEGFEGIEKDSLKKALIEANEAAINTNKQAFEDLRDNYKEN